MSTILRSAFNKPLMGRLLTTASAVCLALALATSAQADPSCTTCGLPPIPTPALECTTCGLPAAPTPPAPCTTCNDHLQVTPPPIHIDPIPAPRPAPMPLPPVPALAPTPTPGPIHNNPPIAKGFMGDCYGAIAYSPSTGGNGYAYNCRSREEAEKMALRYCNTEDAQIVVWAKNAVCILVVGNDCVSSYTSGWGATVVEAEAAAQETCRNAGFNGHVALVVACRR